MPERFLLDTDVVIHLMKKHPDTVDRFVELKESGTTFLLSPIVIAELYAGAFKREHRQIEAFFGLCQPLTLDGEVARIAGHYANRYRKAFQGISLEDYLLAATARQHHCPLWTGNRKHYPMDDIKLFATEELWLWQNPEALSSVQRGLQQSAAGEVQDLGSFAQYADTEIEDG